MDVLVVGAGPTGLMMAGELGRHGVRCRVIDKGAGPTEKSKALAIQARTLEIFDLVGIVGGFLDEGIRLRGAGIVAGHKELGRVAFDHLESPYPFVLTLEQSRTERLLEQHVRELGLQVERNTELVDFEESEEGVEATLSNGERVRARWLVGCDGAHSVVRKKLGVSFHGKAFPDVFSLADIHLKWPYPHDQVSVFWEPEGVMAAFPIPGERRYRLIFQLERCQQPDPAPPSVEEVEAVLQRYVGGGVEVSDPVWLANFHVNSRMSSNYRQGNVFLAGDAAHIHSPVGGQGMNTGLQDAFNLGWKLAWALRGEDYLSTYALEREHVGKRLLKATEMGTLVATLHNRPMIGARNWGVSHFLSRSSVQKRIVRAISQTAIRYPKSALVGPRGGMRAPNAPFVHNGRSTMLFDMWRKTTQFHTFVFEEDVPVYGAKGGEEVVIRPDFYIGSVHAHSSSSRAARSSDARSQ